jgi:hypothetical protein
MSNSANYLEYGPIKINLVHVKEYKREPMYADKEQTHYLYTRHTLSIEGVIAQDNEVNLKTFKVADDAIEVDVIIKHFLTQPRQGLKYVVGNTVLLQSPELERPDVYSPVDCTNGPKPKGYTIHKVNGINSIQVSFTISTDVNESHLFGAPKYPVLSNSYTMEHIIDQDYYTARKVSGLIHFRTDVMLNENLSPDDFRELINIPTPPTMKRDLVKCRLHPGSMKMEYSFLDRETHFHLDTRSINDKKTMLGDVFLPNMKNITRLEITQGVSNMSPTPYSVAQSAFSNAQEYAKDKKDNGGKPTTTGKAGLGFAVAGATVPVNVETLNIQVYGNNLSDKHELEYLIYYIVQKKLPYSRSAGKYEFKLEVDSMGSYARIQVSRLSSPLDVNLGGTTSNTVVAGLSSYATGQQKNNAIHNKFLDASVLISGDKFNLNRLRNTSFFADLNAMGIVDESIEGVCHKTYIQGQINPILIDPDFPHISARTNLDQMRGSFMEQIFVEGIRSDSKEYPMDPHQNTHEYYQDGPNPNLAEKHLGE